jgi:hypothetical protein
MAEIELRVFARQCWHRRLATEAPLVHELAALEAARNTVRAPMHWQFTTPAARVKLAHLYPSPSPGQSPSRRRSVGVLARLE